ncbi:MAG: glycoside hydrolase family 5 protein [Actinomycetota bacterium]|nr:glycoside hydrolase family 5 protein [Actinomycetota bacterium]
MERGRSVAAGCRGVRAGCCGLLALLTLFPAGASAELRVRGNALVDGTGAGRAVQIRGVNRSGLEYTCIQGYGFFDSPHPYRIDDPAMIAAMKRWDINAVRVPLNEDCWLGIHTPRGLGGAPYRRIVQRYVRALNRAGLYVILDLHVAAPGSLKSINILRLPDADHAPAFWRSVAATFKSDHELIFDLYNEPHDIGWRCWLHGCRVPSNRDFGPEPAYQAAGMQQLVDAVRSTGARQPLMLGGLNWSLDLSGWVIHTPHDPDHQLVASEHNYGGGLAPCFAGCRAAILATHRRSPVVFGELGETDCAHGYIDSMMRFADAHGISYLGWTWDAVAPGSWSCRGGPSLIQDYRGDPTAFGVGYRDHLLSLGVPFRP